MEYERIATLATLKGLTRAGWDALGQQLFVEFVAGPPGRDVPWPVTLTPEAAEQLLHTLRACLEERAPAEGRAQ